MSKCMVKVFSTSFPVAPDKSIENLASVIQVWISGSPHRGIPRAELDKIAQDGFSYKKNHVSVEAVRASQQQRELYAVRLTENDDSTVRTTDVVANRTNNEFLVFVAHD